MSRKCPLCTRFTTGCPAGFVGKFGFMARLTDQSTSPALSDLTIKVQELTNGNVLQNADGPGRHWPFRGSGSAPMVS
jgi:hypothetical protein